MMRTRRQRVSPESPGSGSARALAFCSTLILLCGVSCGGSGGTSEGAKQPRDESRDDERFDSDDGGAVESQPPDPCAQGTCSKCGEAVCLAGFYCEEAVSACGWLPQCVDDASCECITKVLSNCSCEERDNGLYVSCD